MLGTLFVGCRLLVIHFKRYALEAHVRCAGAEVNGIVYQENENYDTIMAVIPSTLVNFPAASLITRFIFLPFTITVSNC